MRHVFLTLAAISLAACEPSAPTYITSNSVSEPMITVTGTGEAAQTPDVASVSAGVVTQGKDAGAAMAQNANKMSRVFEELKKAGLEDKDIQTSQLSLQPRYNYQNRKASTITGYEARNTVTAKSYDMDKVGPMLDALVLAGVNNINQVQFSIKDPKSARAKARTDAVRDARGKAESMAEAAGVKLGRIMSLSESGGYNPRPQPMFRAQSMAMDGAESTPVAAGEQTLSVNVNITFEIVQ